MVNQFVCVSTWIGTGELDNRFRLVMSPLMDSTVTYQLIHSPGSFYKSIKHTLNKSAGLLLKKEEKLRDGNLSITIG